MSLVDKILISAGQMQATEIKTKISQLEKEMTDLKVVMYETVVAKYEDFVADVTDAELLADRVDTLTGDLRDTRSVIENEIQDKLKASTNEFVDLQSQLKNINQTAEVVGILAKIEQAFSSMPKTCKIGEFLTTANLLAGISSMLKTLDSNGYSENELHIISIIKNEYSIRRGEFILCVTESWKDKLHWTIWPEHDGQFTKAQLVFSQEFDLLTDIAAAMAVSGVLEYAVKSFTDLLHKNFFVPLINERKCQVTVTNGSDNTTIEVVNPDPSSDPSDPPAPKDLFGKLQTIFSMLNDEVLTIVITRDTLANSDNDDRNKDVSLMEIVGSFCKNEMLTQLISGPLSSSIPQKHDDLAEYSGVATLITNFHEMLTGMKFLQEGDNFLLDFVKNIEMLFVNKKSTSIIETAHKLMKSVLHETVRVSAGKIFGPMSSPQAGANSVKSEVGLDESQSDGDSSFAFPRCHVSVCIRDVVLLAYRTMHETTEQTTEHCAQKLFFTVKNIFEMFCSVVPTYHRQSLQTLPQIAAIHYNNCMYITQHLMTLGFQFARKMPPSIGKEDVCTFVDVVSKIRKIGSESFLAQLKTQKSQLIQFIADANGFRDAAEPESFQRIDRSLKQCLYQLNHLQNMWQPILPSTTYTKAIGNLVNAVMSEMMASVLIVEDISADDAIQLSELFTRLKTTAANLFKTDGNAKQKTLDVQLQKNALKTAALNELLIVLDGSLQDVEDRWADGKGLLAMAFDATQVKHLVRALFQNTEHRAAVLSKIH